MNSPLRMAGVPLRTPRPGPPRPDRSDEREELVRWLPLAVPLLLAAIGRFGHPIGLPWAMLLVSAALAIAGWFWLRTGRGLFILVIIQLCTAGLALLTALPDALWQEQIWLNQVVEVLLMVGYVCYAFNFVAAWMPR